jgi:AAA+ superfamily predicted ATPase
VAELTHKPLYAISTGELGTEVVHAERALKAVFQRAKRWRAVVLLDEADHFLIKRSVGELERNALVTVFLRTLEYFEGIMFLTTNRVEDFDPAFNSRIHLRLHYALPNSDVRSIIWKNLLPGDWSQNICDRLSEIDMNGREIKNLIRTSILIAKHGKVSLSEEVIMKMYRTYHLGQIAPPIG